MEKIEKTIILKQNVYKTISVSEAAKLLGKSEQFVRVGLQKKRLPFGMAVKLSSHWTYYISPKLFYEFVGECYNENIIKMN